MSLTYQQAGDLFATARDKNRGKVMHGRSTVLRGSTGAYAIRYHDTDVVEITPTGYVLNSGGYRTRTTKERINEYSPVRVYSDRGTWYVLSPGQSWEDRPRILFVDGMVINADGTVLNPQSANVYEDVSRDLRKQISAYIKEYDDACKAGEIADPSGGDCWGCYFTAQSGDGVEVMGIDHLLMHISEEERYYVPSLLWNAIKDRGYRNTALVWSMRQSRGAAIDLRGYFRKKLHALVEYTIAHQAVAA